MTESRDEEHHALGVVALLAGSSHEAVGHFDRAIALRGDVARYHSNLGEALRRAGRPEEGATACRIAIAMEPGYFEAIVNLGACLFKMGDHDGALERFEQALKLRPDDATVIAARADAMRELGFVRGALKLYERALELDPDNAHAHANLGPLLIGVGRSDDALEHCRRAVELDPVSGIPYLNLGRCLVDLEEFDEAMDAYADAYDRSPRSDVLCCGIALVWQEVGDLQQAHAWYERALEIDPDRAETLCGIAGVWTEQDRFEEAIATYNRILATDPDNFDAHLGIGRALWDEGDAEGAVENLRRAADLRPEIAHVQALTGSILASAGDVDEAVRCHERALKINPACIPALNGLATTLRGKVDRKFVRQMQSLLQRPRLREGPRSSLHSGLSYYFDGTDACDRAAEHVEKANELFWTTKSKRGWSYDPAEHEADVDRIIETYTTKLFASMAGAGLDDELPVFVVGMPRSGTTLTEQILASHPSVFGAGERPFTSRAFHRLPGAIGGVGAPAIRAAAAWHLDRLHEVVGDETQITRVVDKMPDNYQLLGWLAIAFPNARLIYARRDLRDIAVSCWQTQFAKIQWAFHHDHIAHRLVQHKRLIEHWMRVLPVPLFVSDYETLVADQENESRKLIDFLGLDWDDACLSFHKTERVVRTASVTQVREPIYTRSVERWRRYEEPLRDIFEML